MAELHSTVYYKHKDTRIMKLLDSIFKEAEGDEEKIISICESINPEKGEELAKELFFCVGEPQYDLLADHHKKAGYSVCHFVHGSSGDDCIEAIVSFLYCLCPGIHAQAWGCGDDDPWEFWFKYEDGSIKREDDEPEMDEEQNDEILNTIYKWWHKTMPDSIKEGFLNEPIRGDYIVFTGKMEHSSLEDLKKRAKKRGATVHKSIKSLDTSILVYGSEPDTLLMEKARDLGVKIISEQRFYRLLEL